MFGFICIIIAIVGYVILVPWIIIDFFQTRNVLRRMREIDKQTIERARESMETYMKHLGII